MKNYLISETLANEVLAYLAQRPYQEVFKLIAAVQQLPQEEESADAVIFAAAAKAKLDAEKQQQKTEESY